MVWSGTANTSTSGGSYSYAWQPTYQAPQDAPALVGAGPVECSSCTELSVLPGVIWDVNGYYRELGVSPRATRKELREAYQAKDGQASARLTYILRQLLDPETRFQYDCTPLGELFLDTYVRAWLSRIAKARVGQTMAEMAQRGWSAPEEFEAALLRDAFAQMGIEVEVDSPVLVVDTDDQLDKDSSSPAKFAYSYYVWRVPSWRASEHLGHLIEWQRLLVGALAREGVKIKFAVGFHGGMPHQALAGEVGYRTVFFLNIEVTPSEDLAAATARQARLDRDAQAAARAIPSQ